MKLRMIIGCLILHTLVACGGIRPNVGYVYKSCNDNLVTLDGDTFRLQEAIGSDLLIVCDYPEWKGCSYLMKKARTGCFYLEMESEEITSIDNTEYLVSVNGNEIYNAETGNHYKLPCSTTNLTYLGELNELQAFTNGDTICYSDGKCIAMKENTYCWSSNTKQNVTLLCGARAITATLNELYNFKGEKKIIRNAPKRIVKDFHIKPQSEYESEGIGFSVDLDIPEGETTADVAIREWMIDAIKNDVFSMLGYQKDFHTRKEPSYKDFVTALDDYGMLWEKLCRNNFQVKDTLSISLNCDIRVRMIVDSSNYTTYHYWASIYEGGLHDMPRSYYITYDKNRQTILSAANTVKSSKLVQFRKEVMKALKERHDDIYDEKSSMEDFMQQAFSFHSPIVDDEDMNDVWKSFLIHEYECDEWSGWETAIKEEFSLDNFPLPHFSLLPEGVVVTYHPYQIDCFAAGEYHAIVPYSQVSSCLSHIYREDPDNLPKLEDFLLITTK